MSLSRRAATRNLLNAILNRSTTSVDLQRQSIYNVDNVYSFEYRDDTSSKRVNRADLASLYAAPLAPFLAVHKIRATSPVQDGRPQPYLPVRWTGP